MTKEKTKPQPITVDMSEADLNRCSDRFLNAINEAQLKDGFSFDQVMTTLLLVMGGLMRKRGIKLLVNEPLRDALPPLYEGYRRFQKAERRRIILPHEMN